MTASVTIGEFSRLTHLSVKTLHHYHQIGLLAPARIDPCSGHRRYQTEQVPLAQLIRRLRDLQMPVAQAREVVEAPDLTSRDQALRLHLDRMENELVRTQQVVASLRSMLPPCPPAELAVEYRFVPAFRAYAASDRVEWADIYKWCESTFGQLAEIAAVAGISATAGATYDDGLFAEEVGQVVAFLPVVPDQPPLDGVELLDLPAGYSR